MTDKSAQQTAKSHNVGCNTNRFAAGAVLLAWLLTSWWAISSEWPRIVKAAKSPAGILSWLFGMDADWSLPLLVLLSLPPMAFICDRLRRGHKRRTPGRNQLRERPRREASVLKQYSIAALLALISLLSSASIGFRSVTLVSSLERNETASHRRFYELPPAYHDEFSYLLQANTFLAGRLSWPAMTVAPDLFHQVHVLNRPTTASRYFPWTGLWMAPFEACGHPYFGHWLAGAITCVFSHRCLYRLMGLRYAMIGGLLIAVSPGLACFSNLLLAHHPTMLALSIFLWSMLRYMDKRRLSDIVVAGVGLSLAMLGRPMTAAGVALPFGVWFVSSLVRQHSIPLDVSLQPQSSPSKSSNTGHESTSMDADSGWKPLSRQAVLVHLLAMATPLLLGFACLMIMNHSITGQWTKSAYQLYTDTWTPRHRYGFDNANVDPSLPKSKVLQSYDNWAENLTIPKAIANVQNRTLYSLRWTLGIAALTFFLVAAVSRCVVGRDRRPLLLFCSVLSLHAVHVPYWYDGIMHWHYVFETAPLLMMLATCGLCVTHDVLRARTGSRWAAGWIVALLLSSLIPNWFDAETLWGPSRVTTAYREQSFSRVRFEYFRMLTNSDRIQHPALILVDERGSNLQLSYIINPPDLSGDVIVCRLPEDPHVIDELAAAFPDRPLYVFNPETFELKPL